LSQTEQNSVKRLRELIAASPYTVPDIARECKVSKSAVYGWFKTGRVAKKHLSKLAGLLKTSIEGLLNEGAPTTGTRASELEWSFAAQKLADLFDHLPTQDRQLAWPWLVHMIAHSPVLVRSFLPYPAENKRVEYAFGKAGDQQPPRGKTKVPAKGKR
jgi:AcrR family transcriptional regulator